MTVILTNLAFGAQFSFTPRLSLKEEYNDNIELDRKDKKDDFITTVSPGFTAELAGQTDGLRLSYDPSFSFFADHNENDGWAHNAQLNLWHDFSRSTRAELFNYFLYTKDPLADKDVESEKGDILVPGDPTRRRQRDTYYRNDASVRLTHQFGAEDSAYGSFRYGLLENDDPTQEDSQEFSPAAGVVYWFSNWTGMELHGGYTRGLYDDDESSDFNELSGRARLNRRISPRFGMFGEYQHIYRDSDENGAVGNNGDGVNEDYMVFAPSAGLFYQFEKDLTASLGAGYFYQQIQNDDDQSGPFINADLKKLWDFQRWSIRCLLSSGLDSQDFSSENRGFERFFQTKVTGRYDFTRQLFGDALLGYRYGDFINSEEDVIDHRYTAEAGLGYQVFRWMTLRFAYNFNKLDSENSTDDYEEHRVFFTITLQPAQPYRW
jgi:hypothetical protein